MRHIVLASTSRYRRELLARLGLPHTALAPDYDEAPLPGLSPHELALTHARGKARSLRTRFPNAILIGCDQVVSLDGEVLGKPGTPERAVDQLRRMRGREHVLLTALVVHDGPSGAEREHLDETTIRLRDLPDADLEAYVARERPCDCAGSYRSEALGIALFEYQRGEDPTAVIGLPLIALVRMLATVGVNVLQVS